MKKILFGIIIALISFFVLTIFQPFKTTLELALLISLGIGLLFLLFGEKFFSWVEAIFRDWI